MTLIKNIASLTDRFLSIITFLRNSLFISLFVLTGNYHQAVEKQNDSRDAENELNFLYRPVKQFTDEYLDYLNHEMDYLLKRRGFNGTVLIAHQGEAAYMKSRGMASATENRSLLNEHNVYQLASVSKQFTAFAILMLYEDGKLTLDQEVTDIIDGFPYERITVRHLLNHTSGLQNYFYLIDNYWKRDYLPNHHDMMNMMIEHNLPLNFTPGRRFSYSNTGYAFLAMIVETLSKMSFQEFAEQRIFQPLKMNNSFVFSCVEDLSKRRSKGNIAMGHERMGRRFREIPVDNIDGISGDKGIYASAEDILKWDRALNNNILVSENTKELAFERGSLRSGYRINYGFGFRIKKAEGQDMVYHHGWWKGYRTVYSRMPDDLLIVVLNNTTASVSGLENQIHQIIKRGPKQIFIESERLVAMHTH